jgi:hypothetical protein
MAFAQRERPVMKARALPQQNDRSRAPRPSSLQFCKGVPIPARSICTTRWSRAAVLRWPIAVNGRLVRWRRRVGSRCLLASGSPPGVISVAVRWYLRYGLSYRDVEELLAERGVTVDHVTVYRWVQRFTTEFIEAARPCRHAPGDRWFADETYVKVAGRWTYLYRAVDQHGQVLDVLLPAPRPLRGPAVLHPRAALRHDPGGGHYRPCCCLSAGPGRVDPLSPAHRRALREQPDRNRSRPAESLPAADARPETPPVRADHLRRARVHAESPPRPL